MKDEIELEVSSWKEVDEVTAIEDMRVTRKASWNRHVLDDVVVSFGHPSRYSMTAARGFGVGAGPNVLADVRAAQLDGFPELLQCHLLNNHVDNVVNDDAQNTPSLIEEASSTAESTPCRMLWLLC